MITITIKVWSTLAALFELENGRPHLLKLELPAGSTLLDLLRRLAEQYPRFGAVMFQAGQERYSGWVTVTLNEDVEPSAEAPLHPGDRVGLVLAYQGG